MTKIMVQTRLWPLQKGYTINKMITLRDAIKRLREQYALRRPEDPAEAKRAFQKVLERDFNGSMFREYIVKVRRKGSRLIVSVTHPAIIQELEGISIPLIDAINKELGEKIILDIDFKVVPSK